MVRSNNNMAHRRSQRICALSVVLFLSSPLARADDEVKVNSPSPVDSGQPKSAVRELFESSDLRLGKSDWVLGGPVVDSLRLGESKKKRSGGIRIG
jgi:hypothetical protein